MGLNDTPQANRIHIAFFGRRNAGKSSLVNAITAQELSVVSDTKGTTTDPVYKSMELLPLGPVLIIDTPGIDDEGELGELRMNKTRQVLEKTDIAILVIDASEDGKVPSEEKITEDEKTSSEEKIIEDGNALSDEKTSKNDYESMLIKQFEKREIPYLIVYNKCDLIDSPSYVSEKNHIGTSTNSHIADSPNSRAVKEEIDIEKDGKYQVFVSSVTGEGVEELKNRIAHLVSDKSSDKKLVGDLINPLDIVVLVIPIDSAAPKGRLILPQQQVIRDILEAGGVSVVCKDTELAGVLDKPGIKPRMVITDSQAFAEVSKITPEDIYLTSFSILMARWKGFLSTAVKGADALSTIKDGDEILIAEGCTHHRQCEDIGTVKLPRLIRKYTGAEPKFTFTSGGDFPEDLSKYKIILQCGGCMLNEKAVRYRMRTAIEQGVPFTNYGTAIAKMNGILERSVLIVADEVYEKR